MILSSFFSIVVSSYDVSASIVLPTLLLVLMFWKCSQYDVVKEGSLLSWSYSFYDTLSFYNLINLVSYMRRSGIILILISSSRWLSIISLKLESSSCFVSIFTLKLSSYSCCLSKFSLKLANIYLSVVSRLEWVRKGKYETRMVVSSVKIASFSVDPDPVWVEGEILMNK